jgi:hypothetical protein
MSLKDKGEKMKNLNDWQKRNLPKSVIECAEQYGLALPEHSSDSNKDFWNCHGKWIIKHDGCEIIAKKENITFEVPTMNYDVSPNIALLIKGVKTELMDNGEYSVVEEWSFGEACARNTKMGYWWAMAEKRGKDRVILKLINAYEKGIYSEVESDDWNQLAQNKSSKKQVSVAPKQNANQTKSKNQKQDGEANAQNVINANLDDLF